MTTLQKGKEAIDDNFKRYVSAERDPAMFNLNVAMLAILDGLVSLRQDVESLSAKVGQRR